MATASPESGEPLRALAESRDFEHWKRAALRLMVGWYWRQDHELRFVEVAGRALSQAYPPQQWVGRKRWEWPNRMPQAFWDAHRRELEARRSFSDLEYEVLAVDGSGRSMWVHVTGEPLWGENGEFAGYHGFGWEVTKRKRAELELREREQRFAALFEQSPVGIAEWDEHLVARRWNAAAERIFGWTREEMIGQPVRKLMPGAFLPLLDEQRHDLLRGQLQQGVSQNLHKDGRVLVCSWLNSAIRDDEGRPVGLLSIIEDLTVQKVTAQRIEHLARHDALTHLPNRAYLAELLEQALQEAHDARRALAVLVVNMDRFKLVNDALGHTAGDRLLHSAAQRLRDNVPPSCIVARIGGDEFAVVLRHGSEVQAVQEIGERLRKALAAPHRIEGRDVPCTVSIGGATYPEDGESAGALLQSADAAMTRAKSLGRNNLCFFSASLRQAVAEQLELEFDLRQALARGEFVLHYQPQVEAMTGALVGVEALLRWNHPLRGLVPPGTFIPLAENSGLIVEIGAWVLDEACRQLRAWRDAGAELGCGSLAMAVNLSAHQLREPSLVPHVAQVLQRHGLAGADLELELTESVAMEDPDATVQVLRRLRELGVQLSIDDFGTGYSSLSYLKLLPIHRLKLDRSFVKDIETDPNDAAICSATIALAHKLKLAVVAEGVETELQRNYLLSNGCDYLQGFLFSKPVPAEALAQFAAAHPPRRAAAQAGAK